MGENLLTPLCFSRVGATKTMSKRRDRKSRYSEEEYDLWSAEDRRNDRTKNQGRKLARKMKSYNFEGEEAYSV